VRSETRFTMLFTHSIPEACCWAIASLLLSPHPGQSRASSTATQRSGRTASDASCGSHSRDACSRSHRGRGEWSAMVDAMPAAPRSRPTFAIEYRATSFAGGHPGWSAARSPGLATARQPELAPEGVHPPVIAAASGDLRALCSIILCCSDIHGHARRLSASRSARPPQKVANSCCCCSRAMPSARLCDVLHRARD